MPIDVPPPRASPRVPEDDLFGEEPVTGVYPATREYARHIGWLSVAKAAGLTVVGIAVSAVLAVAWVGHLAETRADARVLPVEARVTVLEQKSTFTATDLHEVQLDLRELYRVGRDKGRSMRLEEPLPPVPVARDGGK